MATGVLAQAGPQTAQQAPPWATLVPMVLILGAFFIVSSRMQKKKQREHAEMLNSVHRGDSVVTSGGIVGEVVTVKDKTVVVRSADAKFEVNKSAISEITDRSGATKES